ncbi:prephenate dehydratase [Spirochaeta africana]|uniref:prephenate dehydratase n=1 Tax=Spirochaeta africana (strain ATCC 700263 / DSM 8902 / Z-7692) TaxID=889378 RepID=H9UMC6_SPIAZ|nr:prephenate dehydratase [Spirochaeta africana]AFG38669.1 prephenate dehydratase [Spirochaeta africana DSM 8902]
MILVINHIASAEFRAALEREVSLRGGLFSPLPGTTATGVVYGLSPEAARHIQDLDGVTESALLDTAVAQTAEDAVCSCGGVSIGGGRISPIIRVSGSTEQMTAALTAARDAGAVLGWISCGRPGLLETLPTPTELEGLRAAAAMGVIVPVGSADSVAAFAGAAAGLHVPYWHMQNEPLLAAVGAEKLPVFLSRHPGATLQEWLAAAEQIKRNGNSHIVLVEEGEHAPTPSGRGIDIVAIAHLFNTVDWPLLVAPGAFGLHGAQLGRIALGVIAAGADGIVIDAAASDNQQLSAVIEQFQRMVLDIEVLEVPLERELVRPPSRYNLPTTDTSAMNQKSPRSGSNPAAAAASGLDMVAFQGERGAYSEAAMRRYFGESEAEPLPCASFHDVFVSVLNHRVRYGIIPLENSLAGSVHENYDHFLQFRDIKIIGEVQIRIEHALIVPPGSRLEQIRRVYSHPQGLAQCSRFLQQFPAWERIPFYDTAGSVQHIAEAGDPSQAAIAGAAAAEVYGMAVVREGIENNPLNFTRFAVIARADEQEPAEASKASMVFSTPDTPGALLRCMSILAQHGLNLKKIESRPIFGKPWQYRFYVDVEVAPGGEQLAAALAALPQEAEDVRLIGRYPVRV